MWKDTPLVEGDMEAYVEMETRMSRHLREAERWRLARGARSARMASGLLPKNIWSQMSNTLRSWLEGPPEPREECC
jgi:hypothetical protein